MLFFIPFVFAGGGMWIAAHQIAPHGYQISLTRAVVTIVLLRLIEAVCDVALSPLVGEWQLLPYFAVSILMTRSVLQLSFWRSAAVVSVYFVVEYAVYFVIGLLHRGHFL